jgi:hypothetical protein
MTDDTDRESFSELVDLIESAGFEITHERFKSDRFDDEFEARFWIRSTDPDTD